MQISRLYLKITHHTKNQSEKVRSGMGKRQHADTDMTELTDKVFNSVMTKMPQRTIIAMVETNVKQKALAKK